MSSTVTLSGEAQEVAVAKAQAVFALAQDPDYRARLAALQAGASDGAVEGEDAETLQQLLEIGLQSGRLRALYEPGGEKAALGAYRRLPNGAATRLRVKSGVPVVVPNEIRQDHSASG